MIQIDIIKAREIGHEIRRAARAEEFKPLDEIIAKQIPNSGMTMEVAEYRRQEIRDRYALMQAKIDAAETPEAIKVVLSI